MSKLVFAIIPLLIFLLVKITKSFHVLQQNRYNEGNHYLRWIKNNVVKVFISVDLILIPIYLSSFFIDISYFLYIIFMAYLVILYFDYKKSKEAKQPLVYTKRIKRLYLTNILVYGILIYLIIANGKEANIPNYYLTISILIYFSYIITFITNIINIPIEKLINHYYFSKAQKRLCNMPTMEVIGITGSYGKTSSKNILSEILNIKYNAFPTPKNYNTVNGLCNTINNYLDKFSDYFIAEMGAVKVHDIKKCCQLVKPKYGILTSIGTAHLETFGSKKNIENEKFELIESLPSDGVGILNGDDEIQINHKVKNNCKILMIGIDNKNVDCYATNIKLSYKGTKFDVVFKGDNNKYAFETCLLGKANVYNILTGILLGKYLGIDIDRLRAAVKSVKPIEHRLELKKYGNINLIDDAYNSNPIGSKMALEVLGMMPGTKIVVTPGMIELGSLQYEANKNLGIYMAENKIDEVILVGEKQTKPILDGLMEANYAKKHIHIINDVKLAFPLMQELQGKDTYVLLENDLPDIFNE